MTYQEVYLMDNLTIEAKAIYGMLCSYAGTEATAYPSVDFMCKMLHISSTRFYKHMNLLIGAGVVEKQQVKNQKGAYSNNVYTLVPNLREPYTQNGGMENKGVENERVENAGDNNNNINNNNINNNNNKREGKRFTPPTVEEVREYCREKGYAIDPERFVDYYTSNGWMVGKSKMKDWKAAVRTWVKRDGGAGRQQAPQSESRYQQESRQFMERYRNFHSSPDDPFQ